MTLALLIPGVGMGGGGVPGLIGGFRGVLGDAGVGGHRGVDGTAGAGIREILATASLTYTLIYPDTVILPGDVIHPDGIVGWRSSRRSPGSGSRGSSTTPGTGSGRTS